MTEERILEQMRTLQIQLDELRAANHTTADAVIHMENEEERGRQHQEDLQRIRGFQLIDDDFMNACFDGYIEGTELLLKIILNKPDIRVKKVTTQRVMKNLLSRDIWLDSDADDSEGTEYNIEVQRADKEVDRKRARYHSSILDTHSLQSGEDFSKLPENYAMFITENDVIGDGLPIYTIEPQITNFGKPFHDGEHIIYVNGADRNASTGLGKLMHDFFCTSTDDMNYRKLVEKVRYFKGDEKGVESMCKVPADMRNDVARQTKVFDIRNVMINLKLTLEQAMDALGIPQSQRDAYAELVQNR